MVNVSFTNQIFLSSVLVLLVNILHANFSSSFIAGVSDGGEHGRGVMLTDFNGDEKIDIVYGNWNGPHRIFLQTSDGSGLPVFKVSLEFIFIMYLSLVDCENTYHALQVLMNILDRILVK